MFSKTAPITALLLSALLQLTAADLSYPGPSPIAPTVPIGTSKEPFAATDGTLFTINGKAGYYPGINAWWLSSIKDQSVVDSVLDTISAAGIKVIRTWGFTAVTSTSDTSSTWFQYLDRSTNQSYTNYGSNGLPVLDYVVSAAEKRGLHLVLPLANSWPDLGGIPTYLAAFIPSFPQDGVTPAGFNNSTWFTEEPFQSAYLNYTKTLVARYMSSPAIFAWELMNEPRCQGCPTSVITDWASSVSQAILDVDPKHMVTLGDEGWFNTSSIGDGTYPYNSNTGVDWTGLLEVPTLSYSTFHTYPQGYGEPESWGSTWISQHASAALAASTPKPCVAEEYGAPTASLSALGAWQSTIIAQKGIAMDMVWQMEASQVSQDVDEFSIPTGSPEWQTYVVGHASSMAAKPIST